MKHLLHFIWILVVALSCSLFTISCKESANKSDTSDSANVGTSEMMFEELVHDFGTLKKGADCSTKFIYTNTSSTDVVLSEVTTSCGCTTPEYTKAPVKPGAKGEIKVKYDSQRVGQFHKQISVASNAKGSPIELKITGIIEE